MGGWAEDNVASNTLESAKAMVAQLRLGIDFGEAFVPGIRWGYAIVPYATRVGGNRGAMPRKTPWSYGKNEASQYPHWRRRPPETPTTLAELLDASRQTQESHPCGENQTCGARSRRPQGTTSGGVCDGVGLVQGEEGCRGWNSTT